MTAYALARLTVRDMHRDILDYLERIQSTLTPYQGRFLVHGGELEVIEGDWEGDVVVIEFPDAERARAWYASPAYRKLLPLRTRHIDGDVIIVTGVGPDYDPAQKAETLRE